MTGSSVWEIAAKAARYAPKAAIRYTEHQPVMLCSPHGHCTPLDMLRGRRALAEVRRLGLGLPAAGELALALAERGRGLRSLPLTMDELLDALGGAS